MSSVVFLCLVICGTSSQFSIEGWLDSWNVDARRRSHPHWTAPKGVHVATKLEELPPLFNVAFFKGSSEKSAKAYCPGSIISPQYILATCFGCLDAFQPRQFFTGYPKLEALSSLRLQEVESVILHPDCTKPRPESLVHNIGLAKLKTPPEADKRSFARVSSNTFSAQGAENLWVLSSYRIHNLQEANGKGIIWYLRVGSRSNQNCSTPEVICSTYYHFGTDNCEMDVGASLSYNDNLIGLLGIKRNCGSPNTPATFVNVSAHFKWIRSIVSNLTI